MKRWFAWFGLGLTVLGFAPAIVRAEVGRIDTAGLAAVAAGSEVFLLDVRTPGEYRRGHIDGTTLIPMNQVPNRLAEIPRDKKIIVICASGARSGAVSGYLDKAGYPDVVNYVDGMMGWERHRLPILKDEN